ncbi:E3 ubiquitin protein ligase DRIP1-like isoform X3 [Panicum virgatum]|uniref:E3 ubiquitin protein ligase DRIP1-like isoform X3 n=1 Tax=Panicum virgatum TaxID=38727 RepID=UPI0019D5E97E|nr:E3 ubiquitin protein ligase DRIP1-like isoform X3 [Panicum virgatum]
MVLACNGCRTNHLMLASVSSSRCYTRRAPCTRRAPRTCCSGGGSSGGWRMASPVPWSSSSSPRRRCSTRCSGGNITKKVGGWRPLGSQFIAAKNKRSLGSKSEDAKMTENKSDDPVDETPTSQSKTKRQFTRRGNLEKRTGSKKLLILTGKQKNIKPKLPNKKRKLRALWFNLVAAFDQKGQPPLPQVVSKILRIKDVDLPASFIQKYLMQKLNLSSEAEVDILCGGKPVSPGMTLHDLAGCWLNKGQKGRVRSSVGTPADGFIAKVFYGRSGSSKPETENNQG